MNQTEKITNEQEKIKQLEEDLRCYKFLATHQEKTIDDFIKLVDSIQNHTPKKDLPLFLGKFMFN